MTFDGLPSHPRQNAKDFGVRHVIFSSCCNRPGGDRWEIILQMSCSPGARDLIRDLEMISAAGLRVLEPPQAQDT